MRKVEETIGSIRPAASFGARPGID